MWAWQVAGAHSCCAGVQRQEDAVCCGSPFLLRRVESQEFPSQAFHLLAASRFLLHWTEKFPFSERFWRMYRQNQRLGVCRWAFPRTCRHREVYLFLHQRRQSRCEYR